MLGDIAFAVAVFFRHSEAVFVLWAIFQVGKNLCVTIAIFARHVDFGLGFFRDCHVVSLGDKKPALGGS